MSEEKDTIPMKSGPLAWVAGLARTIWAWCFSHRRHVVAATAVVAVAGGVYRAAQGPAFFGCIQTGPASRSCEGQTAYVTVLPDASTIVWMLTPPGQPGENVDIGTKAMIVTNLDAGAIAGGGSLATARIRNYAEWTDTVLDSGATYQDPLGGTTPTVTSSKIGANASGVTASIVPCDGGTGATICEQVYCPGGCKVTTGFSFTDDLYPPVVPQVLGVSPSILATTYGTPQTVTITGTPGFAASISGASYSGASLFGCSQSDSTHATCSYTSGAASTSGIVTVSSPLSPAACTPSSTPSCGVSIVQSAVTSVSPSGGPIVGGTSATITCNAGCTGATTASLAGVACTGVSASNDQTVSCTSAAGSIGSGPVAVNSPSSPLAGSTWTYSSCSAPVLTSLTVPMGTAAGGETIGLVGTGFTANGGLTSAAFGGHNGTGLVVTSSTTATIVTPTGSVLTASGTPISATVTSACGTSSGVNFYATTAGYTQFNFGNVGITTSGSSVVSWLDQSGNGNALGGATSHQPTTIANYNGSIYTAVAMNGTPQYLIGWNGTAPVNTQPSLPNQPFTVFWVGDVSAAGGKLWDTGASTSEFGSYSTFRTGGVKTTAYAGSLVDNTTTGPTVGKTDVHEVCYNGASTDAWINETQVMTNVNPGSGNAGASSGITVGAAFNGSNGIVGDLGTFMVYPTSLCAAGTDGIVRTALEHVWNISSLAP